MEVYWPNCVKPQWILHITLSYGKATFMDFCLISWVKNLFLIPSFLFFCRPVWPLHKLLLQASQCILETWRFFQFWRGPDHKTTSIELHINQPSKELSLCNTKCISKHWPGELSIAAIPPHQGPIWLHSVIFFYTSICYFSCISTLVLGDTQNTNCSSLPVKFHCER